LCSGLCFFLCFPCLFQSSTPHTEAVHIRKAIALYEPNSYIQKTHTGTFTFSDIVRPRPQKTYIMCEKGCLIYSCNELKAREHILVPLRFSEITLEAAYVDRCALFQVSLGCHWPSSNFMGKCLRSCRIVALNMQSSIQHYKKRSIYYYYYYYCCYYNY